MRALSVVGKNVLNADPFVVALERTSGAGAQMKRRRAVGEIRFSPAEVALFGGTGDP